MRQHLNGHKLIKSVSELLLTLSRNVNDCSSFAAILTFVLIYICTCSLVSTQSYVSAVLSDVHVINKGATKVTTA